MLTKIRLFALLTVATLLLCEPVVVLAADRPENVTACDFYTKKTIGEITPANQQLLMALVLHSALLGPYSKYNTIHVDDFTGALLPRQFQGSYVDLRPYFNGAFASANTGKGSGEAVNFLDDGGLEAARQSKPGNGNISSMQYMFFTHVYSYFGTFLGCSQLGTKQFPAYTGKASMYEVHKYMYLNAAEMNYFIDQAVRGLVSFGFNDGDAQFVNSTLNAKFNERCAPAEPIIPPSAGPQLQPICTAPDCVLSPNNTCSAYEKISSPAVANYTLLGNYTKDAQGKTSLNASTTYNTSAGVPISTNGAAGPMNSEAMGVIHLIAGVCMWLSTLMFV